jgi:hypothetical protein
MIGWFPDLADPSKHDPKMFQRNEFIRNDYHKPTDQGIPDWNLKGAVEGLQALLAMGYRVARTPARPAGLNRLPYIHSHFAVN